MRRRVHVILRATTQARAVTNRDFLSGLIASRALFARDIDPVVVQDDLGVWQAYMHLRYESSADADADYAAIVARLSDARVAAGSEVTWHDCTHDEAVPQPCVIAGRTVK